MANRFKQKKTVHKDSNDIALDKEIEELEETIFKFTSSGVPAPPILAEKLSQLKAKRSPNKINARTFIYGDTEYPSVREAKLAKALTESGIPFESQVEIELQAAFSLEKEKIQDICLIADFVVDGQFIVDVKGHIMPVFNIKWKMLKNKFRDTKEYFIIAKDSDINAFIVFAKSKAWKKGL